ncbi:zinc chelation protein SecC [Alcanivorax sp. N3-2A]|nr:zinc chelation protein SecC [Alcanivorax sp. N3-2A]|tara:strand:- start:2416 stop:2862 length:447 start_codon:yes stop_codon:yes gene_type:complete
MDNLPCPCQSGFGYARCCQPLHQGQPAATPEALMRSRYSAFVLNHGDYLIASWHPDTRPASLNLDDGGQWLALEVLESDESGESGRVHFRATCKEGNGFAVLEERSRFVREHDRWFYLDGEHTVTPLKPGRNDPCPCGSGRKFKKCCA